jgi:plasmid stabilization system protein ParE
MNYSVEVLDLAKEEIKQYHKYYKNIRPELGKRFIAEVNQHFLFLKKNPLAFSVRYNSTRTVVLKVFPFMIHYYIEENKIKVIGVIHTSRDTKIWEEKTK